MMKVLPPEGVKSFSAEGQLQEVNEQGFAEVSPELGLVLIESHGFTPYTGEAQKPGEPRTDGPTISEWIAAGYKAENYPPSGYAAKSSPDEIAAAIEAAKPKVEESKVEEPKVEEPKQPGGKGKNR